MAANKRIGPNAAPILNLYAFVTSPPPVASTTPASGDPVIVFTEIPGAAVNTADAAGGCVVDIGPSIYAFSVKGIDKDGNSAVAAGDKLYYTQGDTPPLSKKNTGVLFGYAYASDDGLETRSGTLVSSAATATIQVLFPTL